MALGSICQCYVTGRCFIESRLLGFPIGLISIDTRMMQLTFVMCSRHSAGPRATLHEISRMLGFTGKASGIDGGQVEELVREGRIAEVAAYCQEDVVNTYRIWLV